MAFESVGIEMDVSVELEGSRLSFKVVEGSLREKLLEDDKKGYMLKSVTFMPFLGSSYGADIDGYMLIPDGTERSSVSLSLQTTSPHMRPEYTARTRAWRTTVTEAMRT